MEEEGGVTLGLERRGKLKWGRVGVQRDIVLWQGTCRCADLPSPPCHFSIPAVRTNFLNIPIKRRGDADLIEW